MLEIPPQARETIHKSTGWVIVLSLLLILIGVGAILAPVISTLISVSAFGWFFLAAGLLRIVKSFQAKPIRGFWLSFLIGILYSIAGLVLLSNLLQGAITLTLVLGSVFLAEGVIEIISCFKARTGGSLSWLVLCDGVITLILGIFIWNGWPNNSLWLLGFYIGISLIFSGITLLSIATATRKAT
jgi:uncharacterized membrane protein HdeD (DUF308 family)